MIAAPPLAAALVASLLACSTPSPLPAGDPSRPDVLLISVDTLRADHVGAWGYDRPTTPRIDALAADGVRFADAWAPAPWTLPSHATMLSGALPLHHGAIESDLSVDPRVPWLPEAFRSAGYGTVGVVSTWFVSAHYGFDRGFDAFDDQGITNESNLTAKVPADKTFARALELAAKEPAGEPLFVFVHLYDAHYPYDAPSPWDEKIDRPPAKGDAVYKKYEYYLDHPVAPDQMAHQVAQYDEEIAYADDRIGAFLDAWTKARGRPFVAVTADHGEELGERGSWGHGHTLWPETLRVPWVVSGPGLGARVVGGRVGLEDLAPTLAGLAHVSFAATDGVDRSAEALGATRTPGQVAGRYAETSRFDTLRMRWHEPPYDLQVDLAKGALQLCDVAADPGCARDVAMDHSDVALAMEKAMYDWLGAPWIAREDGAVESKGTFVVWGEKAPRRLAVKAGTRFALFPPDADLRWVGPPAAGPWRVLGGALPTGDDPLRYDGPEVGAGHVDVDAGQKERLEALGYVQ